MAEFEKKCTACRGRKMVGRDLDIVCSACFGAGYVIEAYYDWWDDGQENQS